MEEINRAIKHLSNQLDKMNLPEDAILALKVSRRMDVLYEARSILKFIKTEIQ